MAVSQFKEKDKGADNINRVIGELRDRDDVVVEVLDPESQHLEIEEYSFYWDASRRSGSFIDQITANEKDVPTANSPYGQITLDRYHTLEHLEELGVPVPGYCFVPTGDLPEGVDPFVAKPVMELGEGRHDIRFYSDSETEGGVNGGIEFSERPEEFEDSAVVEEYIDFDRTLKCYYLGGEKRAVELESPTSRTGREVDVPGELEEISEKVSNGLGLQLLELDIVENSEGEYYVVDVDYTVNLSGVEDGAERTADAIYEMAKSGEGWEENTDLEQLYSD